MGMKDKLAAEVADQPLAAASPADAAAVAEELLAALAEEVQRPQVKLANDKKLAFKARCQAMKKERIMKEEAAEEAAARKEVLREQAKKAYVAAEAASRAKGNSKREARRRAICKKLVDEAPEEVLRRSKKVQV